MLISGNDTYLISKEHVCDGGNNTKDKAFLLSVEEVERYNPSVKTYYKGTCWLRSPGNTNSQAVFANVVGEESYNLKIVSGYKGQNIGSELDVYPAMWIDLVN